MDNSQRYKFMSPLLELGIDDPPSPTSSEIGFRVNVRRKEDFTIN